MPHIARFKSFHVLLQLHRLMPSDFMRWHCAVIIDDVKKVGQEAWRPAYALSVIPAQRHLQHRRGISVSCTVLPITWEGHQCFLHSAACNIGRASVFPAQCRLQHRRGISVSCTVPPITWEGHQCFLHSAACNIRGASTNKACRSH